MMTEIFSHYLSDPEIAELAGDQALLRQMLRVEVALARVQAQQGIIPEEAAAIITKKLKTFEPDLTAIAQGTLINGIPVIPLLDQAKKVLPAEVRDYLHWGATSQDIVDTAYILVMKEVLTTLEKRLEQLIAQLKALAAAHHHTYMVARTRGRQAVPTTFGWKVLSWRLPLDRHLERLGQMKPRLLVVQLGGAGGNLAALGKQGGETARLLARELQLGFAGVWHSQRDNLAEFSVWSALLSGSLGKMAEDMLLLSQSEIGELSEQADGGGSSTMPHKNNPVLSEAIVALARYTAQMAGNGFQAMLHRQERDGATLALEWLSLPQIMIAAGAALRHALYISKNLQIHPEKMLANLDLLNGLVYSEQAGFILSEHMSHRAAKALVGRACEMVAAEGVHLSEALATLAPEVAVDWENLLQAKNYLRNMEDTFQHPDVD